MQPLACLITFSLTHLSTCALVWSEIHSLIHSLSHLSARVLNFLDSLSLTVRTLSFTCSLRHSLDLSFACSVDSFADNLEGNAEWTPLECWECDSWIHWTSRLPQRHDCIRQWIQTWWFIYNKKRLLTSSKGWKSLTYFTPGWLHSYCRI